MIAKQSIGKSFTGALKYKLKKLNHSDPKQRAEVLSTNLTFMDPAIIRKELAMMKALNPKLKRNTYHTSLNFALGEKIENQKMQQIAEEYLNKMGFDNNLHIIFRHHDSNHPHCHILALRNRFDGMVVSDSRNYQRSEQVIRELENKYNLVKVVSSKHSKNRAPNKDEIEMILRTGKPSAKLLLQEKVRDAIKYSATLQDFIRVLEAQNINVLFNQASTGRVSGITYLVPGFKIRGQALGNQFKFGSITKQINYEQNRDHQKINQTNSRTRKKFGITKKAGLSTNLPGIGIPYSKQWYYYQKSKGAGGLPEIAFGLIDSSQTRNVKLDQGATSNEKVTKEASGHLDHNFSDHRNTPPSILGGMAGLLDVVLDNEKEKKKKYEKRKRGFSR